MRNIKIRQGILILSYLCHFVLFSVLSGCASTHYFSNVNRGFSEFPPSPISIEEAIRIARPFLNQSYKMRLSMRKWPLKASSPPIIYVSLIDQYYYVVKEDYPYQYREAYLEYAVKIDRNTGKAELIKTASDWEF